MTADIRICFVGDSYVNGTGDPAALGWVGRLCAAARGAGHDITCYNLGVRRDTSRDLLARWRDECARRLPAACDGRVVFSCGVNDSVLEAGAARVPPAESARNVHLLLSGARGYCRLLVGPPPVADAGHNLRLAELNRAYAEVAAALGVPYIALFDALLGDAEYLADIAASDRYHPGAEGYAKLAAAVARSPVWWFPAA